MERSDRKNDRFSNEKKYDFYFPEENNHFYLIQNHQKILSKQLLYSFQFFQKHLQHMSREDL